MSAWCGTAPPMPTTPSRLRGVDWPSSRHQLRDRELSSVWWSTLELRMQRLRGCAELTSRRHEGPVRAVVSMTHLSGRVSPDASRGIEGPGPKTLRQPTERHGGNAGIDEEETISEVSLGSRVALIQSNRTWPPHEDVAKAVAVASELEHRIYVERRSGLLAGAWHKPEVAIRC